MTIRSYFAVLLAVLLAWGSPGMRLYAQDAPQPQTQSKLKLVIVEGDGAINNIRQRFAREPIVQVQDENDKPVAGASVVFLLPNQGASGVFTDGSRMLTVFTDENGRAVARGFQPNNVPGKLEIRVTASHQGQTASATIAQTNILGAAAAGAAGAAKLIAILAAVGGAAAAGIAVAATRGGDSNGGGSGPTGPPPTTITPGTPTVGPPR